MYSTTSSITCVHCTVLLPYCNWYVYCLLYSNTVCTTAVWWYPVLSPCAAHVRITIDQYTYCTRCCTRVPYQYSCTCTSVRSIENQYCCVRMHEHTGTAETSVHEPVLKISTVVFKCTSTVPVPGQLYGTSAHVPVLKISTVVFETTSVVSI